jgi:Ca2+-binding RTX toxin-like protein
MSNSGYYSHGTGDRNTNQPIKHTLRRSGILLTLMVGTALSLGLVAPASAGKPSDPITARFDPSTGILTVRGDQQDNTITVSRNAAGAILVNGGAVPITDGPSTVANTSLIEVSGLGGNDTLSFDEANGALPRASLLGGNGNDTLTAGSGGDELKGQAGDDTLLGKGGFDMLFGGPGNDTLTGGDADDQVFGEGGNDRMIWNPGDDTDLNEGGDDIDTVEVNGGNGAEVFSVTANGTQVRFDRTTPAPFTLNIITSENLVLNANGGDDALSTTGNLAGLIRITADGGAGTDTLTGSNGADLLLGGEGNDFVDGQQGDDTAFLGAGDDTFQWDPGDGNDIVEGQDNSDTMLFNGSAADEVFDVSANGERVRFARNIAAVTMDLNDVESVDLNALAGADTFTVNDLSGTDMVEVNTNLAAAGGGGDAHLDTVIVNATNGDDVILASGDASGTAVFGLAAQVNITGAEAANDRLTVNALAGDDVVEASGLAAGAIQLTADGGADDDVLVGGAGNDVLLGGEGDDVLVGGPGVDTLDGGPGNNIIIQD